MPNWAYHTIKIPTAGFFGGEFDDRRLNDTMNALGREGWELVSAFDTNWAKGASKHIVLLFKRAIKTLSPSHRSPVRLKSRG